MSDDRSAELQECSRDNDALMRTSSTNERTNSRGRPTATSEVNEASTKRRLSGSVEWVTLDSGLSNAASIRGFHSLAQLIPNYASNVLLKTVSMRSLNVANECLSHSLSPNLSLPTISPAQFDFPCGEPLRTHIPRIRSDSYTFNAGRIQRAAVSRFNSQGSSHDFQRGAGVSPSMLDLGPDGIMSSDEIEWGFLRLK